MAIILGECKMFWLVEQYLPQRAEISPTEEPDRDLRRQNFREISRLAANNFLIETGIPYLCFLSY